jgi:acyl-CoA synthetase (AMP-forming)/AMP-acid ligase II
MDTLSAYACHAAPELESALEHVTSVNDLIDRWAQSQPDRTAISAASSLADWKRISYRGLQQESLVIAAGLLEVGIVPGDHVGILADGSAYAECLLTYFALLRIGAVMVPVNPRYVDGEIEHALSFSDCIAVVAHLDFAPRLDGLRSRLPKLRQFISMSDADTAGWIKWSELMTSSAPPANGWPQVGASALANVLFTSGTTARPKGVMHTHRTALATGAIFSAALDLRNSDVFHHAIPFFTSSGAQFAIMASIWAGATLIVEPRFDVHTIFDRIQDEGTNVFLGVPSHYLYMLDELARTPKEFPSVRLWDYGGAPMPGKAVRELARLFPTAEQRQNYGMTETGPAGTLLTPDQTLNRIESIGRPMPLCEIKIVNADDEELKRGESGEICVRADSCMTGYYRNDEATAKTLVDGWVHTGDVGWMDDADYVFFSDRAKDIINRGGLKISSMEVEDTLYRHPGVLEAAVIAIPHDKLGEDIVACVVPKPGVVLEIESLKELCKTQLADYKAPRQFFVLDILPRNSMGKVQKAELRANVSLWKERSAAVKT